MSAGGRRLEPLVRHARQAEDQAARALARARVELAAIRERRSMLERYRCEYERALLDEGSRSGLSAGHVKAYRAFLERLGEGIEAAGQELERAQGACREAERLWLERRSRRRALARVIERRLARVRSERVRRDQARLDEHASRQT